MAEPAEMLEQYELRSSNEKTLYRRWKCWDTTGEDHPKLQDASGAVGAHPPTDIC